MEPVFKTRLLRTDSPHHFNAAVQEAVSLLRQGQVVALPTETVYGLAANALEPGAVRKVYVIKGRPANNPLIVHVVSLDMARSCVTHWPETAEALARAFWPGPLTLVLPRASHIPLEVTGGGPTVAIRWPAHPFIQAVIRECGFPLAAPSANLANRLSPTTAEHVLAQLGGRIPLVVDGGPCPVGIESTVLDLVHKPPRILRPGMIHSEALAPLLPSLAVTGDPSTGLQPPASPGLFPKHYAPGATVKVLAWEDTTDLCQQLHRIGIEPRAVHVLAHTCIPRTDSFADVWVLPRDPAAYARALYATWYRCDQVGAQWIVMEAVPAGPAWAGIADRLRRAQGLGPAAS